MRYTPIVIVVAVVALGALVLVQKPDQLSANAETHRFTQIQEAVVGGALLLDVRTPGEYAAGHIDGANNLPLQEIQSGALPNIGTDKTVYVYCQSGNRSAQAITILKKAGYTVEDLGGIENVVAIGGTL